jgi:hypothetical protein
LLRDAAARVIVRQAFVDHHYQRNERERFAQTPVARNGRRALVKHLIGSKPRMRGMEMSAIMGSKLASREREQR